MNILQATVSFMELGKPVNRSDKTSRPPLVIKNKRLYCWNGREWNHLPGFAFTLEDIQSDWWEPCEGCGEI